MTSDQPARPANIGNIVAINQGKRPLTMENPTAEAMSPEDVKTKIKSGCTVLDCRSEADFGQSHIPGSYNIQLATPEFEQRVGWVVPSDVPIVLVTATDSETDGALKALAFVGLDQRVEGYLAGGMKAWIKAGLPQDTLSQISVEQLHERIRNDSSLKVLDVRETSEWETGHVQGAHYMNFKHLAIKLEELELLPQEEVVVICGSGRRSSTAASILRINGFRNVRNLIGGMSAWTEAGFPMIKGSEQLIQL